MKGQKVVQFHCNRGHKYLLHLSHHRVWKGSSDPTWRCWACCPARHRLTLPSGSSPTWWSAGRPAPASATPETSVCLCTARSSSRSRCRASNPTAPAATRTTSLQTWETSTEEAEGVTEHQQIHGRAYIPKKVFLRAVTINRLVVNY